MARCVLLLLILHLFSGVADVAPSSPNVAKRWTSSKRSAGEKCGVRPLRKADDVIQVNSRIIGGEDTVTGGQPWTVSIKFYGRHMCGGSIVERNLVVTVAHCMYPVDEDKIQHLMVVAGEYDLNIKDPQQQEISVSAVKLHPKYKPDGSMSYDIALVYLQKPVILGSRVQRVCLPQIGEKIEPGTLCVTSGWGRVNESGPLPNILQEVTLPILDDETCKSTLDSMRLPSLQKSMLCAGFPDGGRDACQGDSGGPLVCRQQTGTWVLVGSTSWGAGCGRSWHSSRNNRIKRGSPAIFSRVSAFVDFIRNTSSDSVCRLNPFIIVGRKGNIKYPSDVHSNYSSNSLCRWTIIAPADTIIKIEFTKLSIEDDVTCAYDSLKFTVNNKDVRKVCGTVLPSPIIIHSSNVSVTFVSDGSINGRGFEFMFSTMHVGSEKDSIAKKTPVTSSESTTTPKQRRKNIGPEVCGVAPLSPQWLMNRIVGGEEACPHCWPWQILITYEDKFLCGGAIISPLWVVTAAHCVPYLDYSNYRVNAGIHDRLLNESSLQERMVHVVVAHELFNFQTDDYDFALVRLAEELTFNDFVRPACLPKNDEPLQPTSLCVVTGWGTVKEDTVHFTNRLQQLQVPILDNAICNSEYYPGIITDRMFCAGFPETGGKDSCQGDSGGPLVCPRSDNSYVLYGIVSWGSGCAHINNPGVYARVRSFLSWIDHTQQEVEKDMTIEDKVERKTLTYKRVAACPNSLVLDDVVGSIVSPGYPHGYAGGLVCSWSISTRSSNGLIKFVVEHLSIEESVNCVLESLSIYQVVNNISKLIDKLCGFPSTPLTYKSHGPVLRVIFNSSTKSAYSRNGFSLQYKIFGKKVRDPTEIDTKKFTRQQNCSDVILTSDNGVISSPGYPDKYPNDLQCEWRIIAPLRSIIRLDIDSLTTEKEDNVCRDVLHVYQGLGENQVLLGSFCGDVFNYTVKTKGSEMTLVFTSNSKVAMKGFYSRYSFRNLHTDSINKGEDSVLQNCGASSVDPMPKIKSAPMAEVVLDEKGTPRVVGGQAAVTKSWPWIASLQDKLGESFCGAAIIHKKWLLTAAHCKFQVGSDKVIIGNIDRSAANQTELVVRKSYVHKQYNDDQDPPDYDICLLELESPVRLGDSIAVICLPQESEEFERDGCLTAGWGATKGPSVFYPTILQQAKIPLVSIEACKNFWGHDISERNMCAGASGASSCIGDSGGPLICRSQNKYKLVGIVSWGSDTCVPNAPAVYSSVAKYREWIKRHTGF